MEIARLVFGAVLLVVAAVLTVQLWSGRWAFLVAKPEKNKKGTFYPEGTMKTAQRAAWVMVACFAVVATLMAYEMAKMTGLPLFVQTATILGNVALVAFCLSLIWAVLGGRKQRSYEDHFKDRDVRLPLLLLACCVVLSIMAISYV